MNSCTVICVPVRVWIVPLPINVLPRKIWSIAPLSKLLPLMVRVNVLGATDVGLIELITGAAVSVNVAPFDNWPSEFLTFTM